ncbi:MAG: pyridine nucleotide-disulfide oxidoreductase [Myxococcales bacterium]|nr:MAG: pyridine nucleotide-disulfide oxidoreductase [Myxococcales bacterium]
MADLKIDGFRYADLYHPARLEELAHRFYAAVETADADLGQRYAEYRDGADIGPVDESNLLIDVARYLSPFVARLFGIGRAADQHRDGILEYGPLWQFKKEYLGKRIKRVKDDEVAGFDVAAFDDVVERLANERGKRANLHDAEAAFTAVAVDLLTAEEGIAAEARAALEGYWGGPASGDDDAYIAALADDITRWCKIRATAPADSAVTAGWVCFKTPDRIDFFNLVDVEHPLDHLPEAMGGPPARMRRRDGFKLTDRRYSEKQVLAEADYCILCHDRDKDSCSKGVRDKDGSIKKNPLGIDLNGCPLDEKISEMHALQLEGLSIGALAMIIIDNPMCPGTGHRICNDCMKGCIYQKYEPVNIPQIETRVLTDVLDLPWGFEIYALLTRWNPLNRRRPYPLPYNGKDVLVVGLGPAGYTLAHYLVNEGFGVVGIDGLKMEPLPQTLSGRGGDATPVSEFSAMYEELDERPLMGFGGVAEYGITVRWDKNFLKVIRLCLERRETFRAYGGVRFGGTLTIEDAWALGFDHIAIASGAGKPTVLGMKNNLIRGVRTASDFLMALQLIGAQKKASMTNLQVRLPAVVIGGGLTGIDTTTEAMAYYPVQVEKTLDRYETLLAGRDEASVRALYTHEEREVLDEFLEHGRAIRAERERAAAAGEQPDFVPLVRSWGGVSLVYRKSMLDSPAYRLNHEEIIKALEEGIYYVDALSPTEALQDEHGAIDGVVFERQQENDGRWTGTSDHVTMPCKSLFVAAGTSPNVIYEREFPGTFQMDERGKFFKRFRAESNGAGPAPASDEQIVDKPGVFTSYEKDGRLISYFGDNHPSYAGNVVKAMASARDGYGQIVELFAPQIATLEPAGQTERDQAWSALAARLDEGLIARVHEVIRLTPTIVEIVVHAPFATRHFEPGQFYRLQNFEMLAPRIDGTTLASEGMALTGAWVDVERGLLSTIVLEMGGSSRMCATWKKGEPVVLMGPTGAPTEIPKNETVILCGGGLGNAVQFSIGKAMRASGNKVIYFAAYKRPEDVYHEDDIEAAADIVIWSVDAGEPIQPRRPGDRTFVGNVVQAMKSYAEGELGERSIELSDAGRLIAIGSDRMMAAVKAARHDVLAPYFSDTLFGLGSINSTMQCMMKEICGQCLQQHIDPETGKCTAPVFSCFNQDQRLDDVDFGNLNDRLRTNTVLEKLTNLWLDHALERADLPRT